MPKDETTTKKGRWLSIPCPHCGAVIEIQGKWSAQTIRCPTCTSSLTLPARDHPGLKEFTCEWCATPTAFFGQDHLTTLNCPKCRADFPNSQPPSPAEPKPEAPRQPGPSSDPTPAPTPQEPEAARNEPGVVTPDKVQPKIAPKKRSMLERWQRATRLTQLHAQRKARTTGSSPAASPPPPGVPGSVVPADPPQVPPSPKDEETPLEKATNLPAESLPSQPLEPDGKSDASTSTRVPDLMREPSSIPLNLPLPAALAVTVQPEPLPSADAPPALPDADLPGSVSVAISAKEATPAVKSEVVPAVATRKSHALLPWMMGLLLFALVVLAVGAVGFYLRHEKMSKNGFSQWEDFMVYQTARRSLDAGDTKGALSQMETRCGDPLADDALRAFYVELSAAAGRPPLSLPEISLLIRNRRLSTEGTSRILLWEAARLGSPEVRMDAIGALIELRAERDMEPLLRFLDPLMGQQPNDVLGARPDGLAGYEWDIAATRWQALRVRLGDSTAAYTLRRWSAPTEPNRIRKEAAIIETLRLGDEAARTTALDMFSDVTSAIEFRVDVADRLGLGETSGPLRDQIRSWATKGLGESIAKTYGLVFLQGEPKGLARLETALRAGSLYGYLATAAATELVDIRGTSATQALTDAKIYWSQELARLQGEATSSTADENSTLQQIARTVIQGLDLQLARAGDATQRIRFSRELDTATNFDRVRLALQWGEQGLEAARPVLIHIADGGSAELSVSIEERERAMRLILKTAPKELHSFLESALTRASAEHRYRAALRLHTLAKEF